MNKTLLALVATLVAAPSFAAEVDRDQLLIDWGLMAKPYEQTSTTVNAKIVPPADALEAALIENQLITPRRERVVGKAVDGAPVVLDAADRLLIEWGFAIPQTRKASGYATAPAAAEGRS